MLVLAWYGKKNTGKLSYFCPSVPLRKLIQFSWLIWALYPSVSFSETQGHIFVACSHVASLALLLVHHHPTNIYLLGPEDKAKSISQGTTILVRNRKSKQLQNTVIKWNDTSYLLPTTLVVDVWGWKDMDRESSSAEREMKNQMRYDTWAKFYGWWTFTDLQEPHLFSKLLTNDSSLFFSLSSCSFSFEISSLCPYDHIILFRTS